MTATKEYGDVIIENLKALRNEENYRIINEAIDYIQSLRYKDYEPQAKYENEWW